VGHRVDKSDLELGLELGLGLGLGLGLEVERELSTIKKATTKEKGKGCTLASEKL
jgi:hypothetical protein